MRKKLLIEGLFVGTKATASQDDALPKCFEKTTSITNELDIGCKNAPYSNLKAMVLPSRIYQNEE